MENSSSLGRFASAKRFCKFEGLNPTASFKDRGMTMAMTKAVEKGAQVVICASTGNTTKPHRCRKRRGAKPQECLESRGHP